MSLRIGNALSAANNEIDQDIALSHLLLEGNTSERRRRGRENLWTKTEKEGEEMLHLHHRYSHLKRNLCHI